MVHLLQQWTRPAPRPGAAAGASPGGLLLVPISTQPDCDHSEAVCEALQLSLARSTTLTLCLPAPPGPGGGADGVEVRDGRTGGARLMML